MDGATVREGDIFLWTTGRLTRGQETVTRWWEEPEPHDGDQMVKIFSGDVATVPCWVQPCDCRG